MAQSFGECARNAVSRAQGRFWRTEDGPSYIPSPNERTALLICCLRVAEYRERKAEEREAEEGAIEQ